MLTTAQPPDGPDEARAPGDLAEAGAYPTPGAGFDHGLVVLSMGLPYWLVPAEGGGFRLLVDAPHLESVRGELDAYDRESAGWPPKPPPVDASSHDVVIVPPLIWALVVLAVFRWQIHHPGWLEERAALDSAAVFDRGEWWRPFTALFLHADAAHIASNLLCGIPILSLVLSALGRWRGALLLAAASVAGNLAAAGLNHPGPYHSLGASTGIFAGLGLLTGRGMRAMAGGSARGSRAILIPLAAGAALLGLLGSGGFQTDLTAHATGFAAGLTLGFLPARRIS